MTSAHHHTCHLDAAKEEDLGAVHRQASEMPGCFPAAAAAALRAALLHFSLFFIPFLPLLFFDVAVARRAAGSGPEPRDWAELAESSGLLSPSFLKKS
jgi:hypothetical protein